MRQTQTIAVARLALLQWLGQPDADVEAVPPPGLETPGVVPEVRPRTGGRQGEPAPGEGAPAERSGGRPGRTGGLRRLPPQRQRLRGLRTELADGRSILHRPNEAERAPGRRSVEARISSAASKSTPRSPRRKWRRDARAPRSSQSLVDLEAELRRTPTDASAIEIAGAG